MFRLNVSDCGNRVQIVHLKTGRIVRNPIIMALKPNYGGVVRVPFGEDACRQFFQKVTALASHFIINGRGIPAEDFFSQELRLAIA